METEQIVHAMYYAVALVSVFVVGVWVLLNHIDKKFEAAQRQNQTYHDKRMQEFQNYKTVTDTKFETASRRHAELSERITASKLETFKELGGYVTRAEFERRMDRLEDLNTATNEKLDRVLARLPATPR